MLVPASWKLKQSGLDNTGKSVKEKGKGSRESEGKEEWGGGGGVGVIYS